MKRSTHAIYLVAILFVSCVMFLSGYFGHARVEALKDTPTAVFGGTRESIDTFHVDMARFAELRLRNPVEATDVAGPRYLVSRLVLTQIVDFDGASEAGGRFYLLSHVITSTADTIAVAVRCGESERERLHGIGVGDAIVVAATYTSNKEPREIFFEDGRILR